MLFPKTIMNDMWITGVKYCSSFIKDIRQYLIVVKHSCFRKGVMKSCSILCVFSKPYTPRSLQLWIGLELWDRLINPLYLLQTLYSCYSFESSRCDNSNEYQQYMVWLNLRLLMCNINYCPYMELCKEIKLLCKI